MKLPYNIIDYFKDVVTKPFGNVQGMINLIQSGKKQLEKKETKEVKPIKDIKKRKAIVRELPLLKEDSKSSTSDVLNDMFVKPFKDIGKSAGKTMNDAFNTFKDMTKGFGNFLSNPVIIIILILIIVVIIK